jgi:tetratricopeptide (TPR) repeat protein
MLSRVSALHRAGNYPESVALGREALEQAKVLDWPPLVARAELELGTALDRTAEYEESETMLEDAFFSAGPAGAVDVAAEAALQLILSTGERQGRPKDALRWARHAEDALERLGERDGRRMATLTAYRGRTQLALGDTDAAQALYVRALELIEDAVGFDHPDVASTLTTYAGVQYARGDYAGAKASLDRALSITESALGPDHPSIGAVLNNLAAISELLGDREAALAHYERAIAISERNLGPDHPTVATLITNLASFHHSSGDAARAEPLLRRALAVRAKTGVEDAVLASTLDSLGYVLDTLDQDEEATETFQRSLALREKLVGADDPTLAYPLLGLASIALTSGHAHEAIPLAERAVALRDRPDIGRDLLALARATLGRALFESGTDRTRGIALVEEAHTTIVAMGTAPDGTSPETLERWLAEHRPPEPQPSR